MPLLPDGFLTALFEQAPFSAVLYDRDGRPLAANAAFTALMGLTLDQVPADYTVLSDPQLAARGVLPLIERAFAGEAISLPPLRYDGGSYGSTGRVTWTQAQLFPLRDPNGDVARVVLIHTDLTERLRMEESLRDAQQALSDERQRLVAILHGISHGVTVQDESGRLVYANDAAARVVGYPSSQAMLGADVQDILARFEMLDEEGRPFDLARLPAQRALQGEDDATELIRYRVKETGEEHWSLVRARLALAGDGATMVVNVFHDITDRITQQRALQWAEERSSFLAEAGRVLASSLDYTTTLRAVVRLAVPRIADWCTISMLDENGGLQRIELAHHDPAKLELAAELERRYPAQPETSGLHRVARTGVAELYSDVPAEALAAAATDAEHLRLLQGIGMRSAMIVPLKAHDRVLGVLTLIASESDRRYDAADLEFAESLATRAALAIDTAELYRQAQEANRAKSTFLAVMSHELRTPLNAILGYADLLDAEVSGELNAAQREHLGRIGQSAQHLTQLIETILSFARIDAGKEEVRLEPAEIGHVVREAAALLEPAALRKGLRLNVQVEHGATCSTDVARLRQILLNLLSNAVKFTDTGSVTVSVSSTDAGVMVRVADTGVGMRAEDLPRIWQPFTRLDATLTRNTGGAGLGLTVSASLAELIGGRLEVESEPGVGTTFTLALPC